MWWILKDVCRVLWLSNSRKVSERLDDDEKGVTLSDTPGKKQSMTVINESRLYGVILRSDKPNARAFRKWITSHVLP
ncbi:MAG: Bro-N domain-containing protein, partial [Oscillospiraceae bacterium]|nr:Bro-N domain-containing protein [Oscillospiraceae bacterium]